MTRIGWMIAAVLAVGVGALVWQGMRPGPEGHSMTSPDTSGIADGAAIVKVSVPDELSSEDRMGERAFNAKCAACHGANAAGREGRGPPLIHKIYEPGHHADMAFVMAARNGVRAHHWRYGNMPPVDGVTDADVKAITAYVRALQKENGIF
ncbi:c-type cytochrome [Roseovarius ramblicola]|uniref:C-type cytochrome n=1 Tax=Roseovarius ramblicola TaxID=2022336 RepID=A0ABV5I1H3_9RHOB